MAEILDSGTRREFDTGAVRDMAEGKGNFSLLPWEVIWDLAKHYEKGNKKYPPGADGIANWKKGIPVDSYFDSAVRHLVKHKLGWTDEDHAVSALWNICGLIWEERYSPRAYKTDIAAPEHMMNVYDSSTQFNVDEPIKYNFDDVDEAGAKFREALERAFGND